MFGFQIDDASIVAGGGDVGRGLIRDRGETSDVGFLWIGPV